MSLIKIRRGLFKHIQINFLLYFVLFLLLISGIIIGAFFVKELDSSKQQLVLKISNAYYRVGYYKYHSKVSVFRSSVIYNTIQVLGLWFLGLFNLGFLVIPIIIILRGFTIGFTVGYLVNGFGFKGFLISIFGIYTYNLLMIPAIIGIGALSMVMSLRFGASFKRNILNNTIRSRVKDYTVFVLVYTMLLLLGSLIEGFISPIFLKYAIEYL